MSTMVAGSAGYYMDTNTPGPGPQHSTNDHQIIMRISHNQEGMGGTPAVVTSSNNNTINTTTTSSNNNNNNNSHVVAVATPPHIDMGGQYPPQGPPPPYSTEYYGGSGEAYYPGPPPEYCHHHSLCAMHGIPHPGEFYCLKFLIFFTFASSNRVKIGLIF